VETVPPIPDLDPVGSHFFVPDPLASGTSAPKFESGNDFVIATKNNSVASPASNFSVAEVLLQNIQFGKAGGTLANWVVRTNVIGGVVPSELNNCGGGDTIGIPYRADYLFFTNS
jgi:hypothetical protein